MTYQVCDCSMVSWRITSEVSRLLVYPRYHMAHSPIILGKLSVSTRWNLAHEHSSLEWTIDEVQAAILKEIRVLESGLYTNDSLSYTPVTRTPTATASFYTALKGGHNMTPSSGKKKSLCIYCKGEHSPNVCTMIADYQKRLDIVKKENLCFNCLGKHKISQCDSSSTASVATISIVLVCVNLPAATTSNQTVVVTVQIHSPQHNQIQQRPWYSCSTKHNPAPKTISLLKTAIAPITINGLQIQGNILFDEGSQRSFITKEIASKLYLSSSNTEHVAIAPFGTEYKSPQPVAVGHINAETESGSRIPISALIVPFISAPLKNSSQLRVSHIYMD